MKKNAVKESMIPVDMKYMREFRAEMMGRFMGHDERFAQIDARFDQVDARFAQIDARFEQMEARFDQIDARFEEMEARFVRIEAKLDQAVIDMKAIFHQAMIIFEEQNLRNKQSYDAAAFTYEALQDLRNSLKPEALK